jgi:membrane protease YdiL (CAAX protease family)
MQEAEVANSQRSAGNAPRLADSLAILAFAVALIGGEAVAIAVGVQAALVYEAVVLAAMSFYGALGRLSLTALRVLFVLAIVPLTRVASIALPQRIIPQIYWDALPAAVALFAVAGIRLFVGEQLLPWFPRSSRGWVVQVAVALAGIPLAIAAVMGSLSSPLDAHLARPYVTVALVAGFAGLALEVLFRGAIQPALVRMFGWSGVALTTLVYAGMFLGTGSTWLVVAALVTGTIWGVTAAATRAMAGVAVSHMLFAMIWATAWFVEFHQ